MNTAPIKISPSKQGLNRKCNGAAEAQAPYPWEDSIYADRGRELHRAMALLFQMKDQAAAWKAIRENKGIKPEDAEKLAQVYQLGLAQLPDDDDVQILVEQPLDMAWLGMQGGKPDLAFLSPKHKAVIIIDWKFGSRPVEDVSQNAQMQDYAAGFMKKEPSLESAETIIIQPWNNKPEEWVSSHTYSKAELREIAMLDKAVVEAARVPGAPRVAGPHCESMFCAARKEGASKDGEVLPQCQAYADWKAGKVAEKQEAKAQAVAAVTTTGEALQVTPDDPLNTPLIVINAETVARTKELRALAAGLKVVDQATSTTMGRLAKDIRALGRLIDANRKEVASPFYKFFKKINASADLALKELEAAAEHADAQVNAWNAIQQDKLNKAREEQAAAQRKAEQAQIAFAQEQLKKEQEAQKALQAAREAEERAANLKSKAARDKAQAEALKQREAAEAAQRAAEEEERKAKVAENQANTAAATAAQIEEAPAPAGYRYSEEAVATIPDLGKVPKAWLASVLTVDEKALDLLVKNGKLNEATGAGWLTIKRDRVLVRAR